MNNIFKLSFFVLCAFILIFCINVFAVNQLMGFHGKVTSGTTPVTGNLTVYIYDANEVGNLIYDSDVNFYGAIVGGLFDVTLGVDQDLDLNYGTHYWLDVNVNGSDLNFSGIDRKRFEASRGLIKHTSFLDANDMFVRLADVNAWQDDGNIWYWKQIDLNSWLPLNYWTQTDANEIYWKQTDLNRWFSLDANSHFITDTNIGFITNGAERMRISVDGNVGIGTSDPVKRLHVVSDDNTGTVRLTSPDGTCDLHPETGALAASCSSDARLKSNIKDAASTLQEIMRYNIRDYVVKASGALMTGAIAQEMLADSVLKNYVLQDGTGYYMVKEPNIWKIVKAIQEIAIGYEVLKKENTALKKELDTMKKELCNTNKNYSWCGAS